MWSNLVPPCEPESETSFHGTNAGIGFGVNALKFKHYVVLGHASCGGVAAYASNAAPLTKRDFIGKWMSQVKPVAERVGPCTDDRPGWIRQLEWAVVDYSLENLMTFPAVRDAVDAGELTLNGAYLDRKSTRLNSSH